MRRMIIAGILASAAVIAGVGDPRADAHTCAGPVVVGVDEPATINVGVTVEELPVVGVDVTIPDGFDVDRIAPVRGWTSERSGDEIRYRGGSLRPFDCGSFTIGGKATVKDTLAFTLTLHHRDGSTTEHTSLDPVDPTSAQLVYAGVDPEVPGDDTGGAATWTAVGIGLIVAGVAAGAVWFLRRR